MDRIIITGGTPLHGEIPIGGAKNAALPLMAAALLSDKPLVLDNLPGVADIHAMGNLLAELGAKVDFDAVARRVTIDAGAADETTAPYDIVRKCAPRCWCWGRCWRDSEKRGSVCRVAARSGRDRLICT